MMPHCSTCRCAQLEVPANAWRRYSTLTVGVRRDCGCGAHTSTPGPDGWWWRFRPSANPRRGLGKATDSLCAACGAKKRVPRMAAHLRDDW